jgi:outer membrane murein-binding lipoprotein Lpp
MLNTSETTPNYKRRESDKISQEEAEQNKIDLNNIVKTIKVFESKIDQLSGQLSDNSDKIDKLDNKVDKLKSEDLKAIEKKINNTQSNMENIREMVF